MKKFIVATLLTVLFGSVFTPGVNAMHVNISDEDMARVKIIYEALEFDAQTGTYSIYDEMLFEAGFSELEVNMLEEYLEEVNVAIENGEISEVVAETMVIKIVAAFVAGAVSSFVLDRLFEWGVSRWCRSFRNTNSVTRVACDIWG